jgi:hypothetical protein
MGLETFLGETVDECPMSVDEEFARHKKWYYQHQRECS